MTIRNALTAAVRYWRLVSLQGLSAANLLQYTVSAGTRVLPYFQIKLSSTVAILYFLDAASAV